jgi:hypothetical protein
MTRQEVIKVLDEMFQDREIRKDERRKTALDITIEVLTQNVTDFQLDHTVGVMRYQGVVS